MQNLSTSALYQAQKEKCSAYWKQWGIDIPWDKLFIPPQSEGLITLGYEPRLFTEDQKIQKYKEHHGEDVVWCYYHTQNKTIEESIKRQGARPIAGYLYWYEGNQEPDTKHLNKSYDMFSIEYDKTFAIPTEGITMADRYRLETGTMMDIVGLTRFDALDADGNAMSMCRNGNGRFFMNGSTPGSRDEGFGPREIKFLYPSPFRR